MRILLLFLTSILLVNCNDKIDKTKGLRDAKNYVDTQDFKSALPILDKIIKQNPDFDSALVERAFVNLHLNNLDYGLADVNEAIRLNFSNNSAYFVRALIQGVKQDFESALKDYTHVINTGDTAYSSLALMERAVILDYYGKFDDAIRDFDRLLKIDTLNIEALNGKALMYTRKQEDSIALRLYTKSIMLNPHYSETYYKRGLLLHDLNDNKNALDDLNRAIILDSSKSDYFMTRGLVYRDLRNIDLAVRDLDNSIKINPKNGYAFLNRGFIKEQNLNNLSGAVKDYKEAKKLGVNK
jgi:tetratricopeptide (TPR) repeat protein